MDQSIRSNELTYCSRRNSPDLLLLNPKSVRSSSSSTNLDLVDLGIFDCLYPESVQASLQKSLISSSTSDISMPPVSRLNHSNSRQTNGKKHHSSVIQGKSSYEQGITDQLPKRMPNKQLSSSHPTDIDLISQYKLSNFFIKIEQLPDIWKLDPTNERSTEENNEEKKILQVISKPRCASDQLQACSIKSSESDSSLSVQSAQNDPPVQRSPKYRPRHRHFPSTLARKSSISISTESIPERNLNKSSPKFSRRRCRSPILVRRAPKSFDSIDLDPTLQPIVLLSFNINERILLNDYEHSTVNVNKRALDCTNSDDLLIKRRHQQSLPIIVVQRKYCLSYPINISRCVDCQTIDPGDLPTHLTGCRFQHHRILKYFGDEKYTIEGFTTTDNGKSSDMQYLLTSDSNGQSPLNSVNASYILTQIAKFFCLMFSHEESERNVQNEKEIISKRYMPGWREVCDECSTTLFNCHYMCKICGYMICIECVHRYSQMNPEKRKKLKRICQHEDSYCLSEFIPWNVFVHLHRQCLTYLSKLKLDYSLELFHSKRNQHLSIFLKSLKMKRFNDKDDIQKIWSTLDCNFDPNIEFYCQGRLPVFNEWTSPNAKDFFQRVWSASCPVLVKQVHRNLSKTLWHPNAFKAHMIDHRETPALWDCETLTPIQTNESILTQFWDGFERLNVRLKDGTRTRVLKLKDWPTKKDFAAVFPTRLHDLMCNIPFGDYTRRSYVHNGVAYHGGVFNIVERLPEYLVKPDLGPKLYIAYSQLTSQASRKAGTTNLHIDVSDAVNVLVYVGVGGYGDDGSDKRDEIRQVESEILKSNIDEAQLQRLRNGERPGALWHLFRADDVKKIRQYLNRTQRKGAGFDPIHDQTAYLEKEDLDNLKEMSNVESYPILQFLGDAIFIPSGAPHQVKNLHSCIKIAEDFVSPENLDRSLITTNEFRSLSKTHTNHADILQARNILCYATRDALNSLNQSNYF